MAREKRLVSREFLEYQELIVNHPNYSTLPNKKNSKGEITWVRQGDKARAEWWDDLKRKYDFKDRATVARYIHPPELKGLKPCQVCGKFLNIHSIYPDTNSLKKINKIFNPTSFKHFEIDIGPIASEIEKQDPKNGLLKLATIFGLEFSSGDTKELVDRIVHRGKGLSPGVMSNAPDRLDGFHTYNACCRSTQDTGRHASNLARYSSDRRAYENWAEGDWRGADRLMGLYKKEAKKVPCPQCGQIRKMSPDHIGPISLGFMHRLDFQPMCKDCNSSKNNRMTYADVKKLIELENQGTQVVSWHSELIWNTLKFRVKDDASAVRASVLLRRNMHHVLVLLSIIHEAGFDEFLRGYLHPEYAFYDFRFEDFDPSTGKFTMSKYEVHSKNTQNQAERYVRISFENLEIYAEVENRNTKGWENKDCDRLLATVLDNLSKSEFDQAKKGIQEILKVLANQSADEI